MGSWTASRLSSSSSSPVFEYSYEYQGSYSLTDVIVYGIWKLGARVASRLLSLDLFSGKFGVCHSDEVFLQAKSNFEKKKGGGKVQLEKNV